MKKKHKIEDSVPKYNWHNKSIDETLSLLNGTKQGLSDEEANKRQQKLGKNSLPQKRKKSILIFNLL